MNDEQIKHMVERFLAWKLPDNFNPDAGISFERLSYKGTPYPMPTGTNLLDYTQAEAMVRHMVEGLRTTPSNVSGAGLEARAEAVARAVANTVSISTFWDSVNEGTRKHLRSVALAALSTPAPITRPNVGQEFEAARNAIWSNTGCSDSAAEQAAHAVLDALEEIGSDLSAPITPDPLDDMDTPEVFKALASHKSAPEPEIARAVEVERGWLIEESFADGMVHWIALETGQHPVHTVRRRTEECEFGKFHIPIRRTKDAAEALRFAREADARAFIDFFERFLLGATATEHEWHGRARTPAAPAEGEG